MERLRGLIGRAFGSGDVYLSLRRQILDASADDLRLRPTPELPRVWGLVMDMGFPNGVASLVAIADGSTSLYYSSGGGIIGGGGHARVVAATHRLLMAVEGVLDAFAPNIDPPLPVAGGTVFRILLFDGRRAAAADEERLGAGDHVLSPVFYAAHDVIGELRLIDEARG
ncbi:MAG: hypothetical protein ABWY52_04955 [Candidatus Limnocylindrales bacterium]